MTHSFDTVLAELKANRGSEHDLAGMARFGIAVDRALGVRMPVLRALAKRIGRDHALAGALWDSGIHEARILAGLVGEPDQVTEAEMEAWVREIDSWDVCDGLMGNLYTRCPLAWGKALEWTGRREEFVRRSGFVLAARLAVQDKAAGDACFIEFLPLIEGAADDDRNFVMKAVNWALRQIGKRNGALNRAAISCAERLREQGSRSARWIASDALRELRSNDVQARLARR